MTSRRHQISFWIAKWNFLVCGDPGKYTILVTPPDQEGYRLEHPEPEYETEGGAIYAIMLFLQTLKGELK